jgi:hypothetical protein
MLCSCFFLSFDACIVTITWSLLFAVIALWVICLTQEITLAPCSSSVLRTLMCFLVFYQLTRKHLALLADMVSGLNPSVKLHALHGSVVPVGVIVLLGLHNPPR